MITAQVARQLSEQQFDSGQTARVRAAAIAEQTSKFLFQLDGEISTALAFGARFAQLTKVEPNRVRFYQLDVPTFENLREAAEALGYGVSLRTRYGNEHVLTVRW